MNSDKIKIDHNKKYLETNNVAMYVEEMMSGIMKEKPEEPLIYMMKFIQRKASQKGLRMPLEFGVGECVSPNDGIKKSDGSRRYSSTNKSYDKPWLSGTNRNELANNNNANVINIGNNENISSNQLMNNNASVDNEFKLCVEPNNDTIKSPNPELPLRNSTPSGNSSKTKENLLQLINEDRQMKINEKLILEAKVNEKEELNQEYDSAIELAEDPGLYCNEFNVNPPNETLQKNQTGVIIMKQTPLPSNHNEAMSVKFGICANCSKFYQYNANELLQSPRAQDWNESKNSLIMDDLESASQVNGPRMIDNGNELNTNRSKYNKKKISVSDFEINSKAWPVIDAISDSSNNRATARSKISNRNLPR